jgi:hypothetical protein
MNTITKAELQKIRVNAANRDIAAAKRHFVIIIAQTTLGNLTLKYNIATNMYKLVQNGKAVIVNGQLNFTSNVVLAEGAPKVIRPVLAAAYDVVLTDTEVVN